ncbi:hypothetical protein [Brevifollis gellanilyticus]|uniref:Uncharacterized protein n=1 Tax=Brevifollis gellanilyticus TaxID=748831 RepID=A0A512M6H0_9BACT|nr:hypothetical protein [Brevifollis gellanilyticus]GEP42324.1 hypothetical protein BGE01nite_16150 [Brevifollis gellanilyticus]
MSLPRSLLALGITAGLWWAGHALSCSNQALRATGVAPAFALPGSAYGSLTARLIRDSLYSYWHGGESAAPAPENKAAPNAPPPPPPPGRFARKGMPQPAPPTPSVSNTDISWLQGRVDDLTRLEKSRTKRTSSVPLSAAHQNYLRVAADMRLRLAYQLDPGDAVLYEILHFHIASRTQPPEAARPALDALARSAMDYAVREGGSLSDALTGAGAAINLLNDQLQPGNQKRDNQAVARHWQVLERCLQRYQSLKVQAQAEGWWEGIPTLRRKDLEEHASLLMRIRDMIQRTLANGTGSGGGTPAPTPAGSR